MLIFMLLLLSASTVIHGLNDPKTFEDSYEEYDEEHPVNTTGYELVVPESFTSYLEQLLANDGREDQMNKSKLFDGTKEENQGTINEQYSNQSHNFDHNKLIDLHQTLESLATSFINSSDGLQSSGPTIFHPYGTHNITQLLGSLGKLQYLSSLRNHTHEQPNSHPNKHMAFQQNKSFIHKGKLKKQVQRVINHINNNRIKYTPEPKFTKNLTSTSRSGKKQTFITTQNDTRRKFFNRYNHHNLTLPNHTKNNPDQKKTVASKTFTVHDRSYLPTHLSKIINNRTRVNNILYEKKTSDDKPTFSSPITNDGNTLKSSIPEKTHLDKVFISKGHTNVTHSPSVDSKFDDNKRVDNKYDSLKKSINGTVVSSKYKSNNIEQYIRNIPGTVDVTESRLVADRENNNKVSITNLNNNSNRFNHSNAYDDLKLSRSSTSKPQTNLSSNKNEPNVTDKSEAGNNSEEWFKDESVETTSLEYDKTTRNETEKHPIEDLLDSLVKITSSKKSLKRRKKQKLGNILINAKLDTNMQPKVTTVASNKHEMNISPLDKQNIKHKTGMFPDQSTRTDVNITMVPKTVYFNGSKTYLPKGNANLASSEDNKSFNPVNKPQVELPVNNSESANTENHFELPNSKVNVASKEKVYTFQPLFSKYEKILKELSTKIHRHNKSVGTYINNDTNNSPHEVNTQKVAFHSPPSTKPVIPKVRPEKNQEIGTKIFNITKENNETYSFTRVVKPHFSYIVSNEKEQTNHALPETRRDMNIQRNGEATIIKSNDNVLSNLPNKTASSNDSQSNVNTHGTNVMTPKDNIEISSNVNNLIDAEKGDTLISSHTNKTGSRQIGKEDILIPTTNITNNIQNNYTIHNPNAKHLVHRNRSPAIVGKQTPMFPELSKTLHFQTKINTSQLGIKENVQNFLSNNTNIENIVHDNVRGTNGNVLENLQHDLNSIVESYIGNTNTTKAIKGYSSRPQGSNFDAAIKKVDQGGLAKTNDFENRSLSQEEINVTKPIFKIHDPPLTGEDLLKPLSTKSVQKQEEKTISDLITRSTNENPYFISKGENPEKIGNAVSITTGNIPENQTIRRHINYVYLSDKLNRTLNQNSNLETNESATIRLNEIKRKTTDNNVDSADVEVRPNFNISSVNLSKNKTSSLANYYPTNLAYTNQDMNKERQQVTKLKHGLKVEEEELKQLITNLNDIFTGSEHVHSDMNEEEEVGHNNGRLDDHTQIKISKNETFNVTSKIVPVQDKNIKQYSQKNKTSGNTIRLEPRKLVTDQPILSNSNNKDTDSSGSNNWLNLKGDSFEPSSSTTVQAYDIKPKDSSENRTYGEKNKTVHQQQHEDNNYPNNPDRIKHVSYTRQEKLSDKNASHNGNLDFQQVDNTTPFVSKNTSDTDKGSNNKPTNVLIKNAHTQQPNNTPGRSDVKQKTYILNPLLFIESNKNAVTQTSVQEKRINYTSAMNKNIVQNLDQNSRLHIIISPLESDHNVSVKIKVEHKISSTTAKTLQLQTKTSVNSASSVLIGENENTSAKINPSQLQSKKTNNSGSIVFVTENQNGSSIINPSKLLTKETNNSGCPVFIDENKNRSLKTNPSQLLSKKTNNSESILFVVENQNGSSTTNSSQLQNKETKKYTRCPLFNSEHKNRSSKSNPSQIKTNQTNNSGSPVFIGENKIDFKNSKYAVDVLGSHKNLKLRSATDQFNSKREVKEISLNNNRYVPTMTNQVERKNPRNEYVNTNNSTTAERLLQSEDNTLNVNSTGDNLISKDFSLDVKRSNKVTNRKRITKKEEVVEVNEKIKENKILGKSKTVQTIKTEVNSVDYV